jgi:hypothetical protein
MMVRDGRDDYEEQDDEEADPEVDLEGVNDTDPLFFD